MSSHFTFVHSARWFKLFLKVVCGPNVHFRHPNGFIGRFLSPPVFMQGGLIGVAFCPSGHPTMPSWGAKVAVCSPNFVWCWKTVSYPGRWAHANIKLLYFYKSPTFLFNDLDTSIVPTLILKTLTMSVVFSSS